MNRYLSSHWTFALATLFCVDFFYQYFVVSGDLVHTLAITAVETVVLAILYFVCTQKDIFKTSIIFLSIPYLFFIPGWLNLPTALFTGITIMVCLYRTLNGNRGPATMTPGWQTLLAFLLIVTYVNLSGIGGYGYQSPDYSMHNSRLNDLITHDWPVQYAENKHLVYYVGYFLPAAVIGKLTSYDTASYALYFWSILGLTLVFRWLQHLSGWRLSIGLVLLFMFFGSLDILNTLFFHYDKTVPVQNILFPLDSGGFEFITRENLSFFIGNYLSHTLQLYFAPHQVIAGWIGMGLLVHLYLSKQSRSLLFVFALLSLWSPFVMLGMSVVILMMLVDFAKKDWRRVVTFENTLGALTLCLVFMVYYLGGSAGKNPSIATFTRLVTAREYLATGLLLIAGWVIYAAFIWPYIRKQDAANRWLFGSLLISLLLLPLWIFGSYNDLLCRGSAPLMLLLFVYYLKAVQDYWQRKCRWMIIAAVLLFAIGSLSALQQHTKAVYFYGAIQAPATVTQFKYGWENLGPDNSVFGRYMRAD